MQSSHKTYLALQHRPLCQMQSETWRARLPDQPLRNTTAAGQLMEMFSGPFQENKDFSVLSIRKTYPLKYNKVLIAKSPHATKPANTIHKMAPTVRVRVLTGFMRIYDRFSSGGFFSSLFFVRGLVSYHLLVWPFFVDAQASGPPLSSRSPILCHAHVSRAKWTSSTGHVAVSEPSPAITR